MSAPGTMETALSRLGKTYDGQVVFADELMHLELSRDVPHQVAVGS